MSAELQAKISPRREEPLDFFIGGAGEEKDVVKIALAGELGFFLRQASVLGEFAGREGAQSHNRHAGILGERLQGLSGGWKGLRDGQAGEAPKAHSGGLFG